jgi:hypothetical protein
VRTNPTGGIYRRLRIEDCRGVNCHKQGCPLEKPILREA